MMRLLSLIGTIVIIGLLWSCASPPERDAPAGEEGAAEEPSDAEEAPEILTISDAYEAISLAVEVDDPEAAIAAYQEASLEDPDDPVAQILLANLYLIGGEVESAQQVLDAVLAVDPDNSDALYVQSLILAAQLRPEDQRELLERVVEIDPDNADAHASLGELYLQRRQYRAAEQSLRRAVELEEENLVARVALGNLYLRRERYEDAEEELTRAIELEPAYSFAYADRARARAQQYELSAAARDLSTAIELDPDYYWHYIDRGRVRFEQRAYGDAEKDFTVAVALDPSHFLGHLMLARSVDALGDYERALPLYEQTLEMRPDYRPAYPQIAVLYYMFEHYERAGRYFRLSWEDGYSINEYALLTALSLKRAGNEDESRRFLIGVVNTLDRDSIMYHMMRYYIDPRNESLVLTTLRDERDDITSARMYFYVGEQMHLLGRTRTAEASFSRADAELPPGFIEQRLAEWRLRSYGSQEEEGDE
jgi:tetratricopeptide (TPR) repeat protein